MNTINRWFSGLSGRFLRVFIGLISLATSGSLGASVAPPGHIERVAEIRAKLLEADAKQHAAVPGAEQESASFVAQYRRGWGNWRNY